MERVRELISQFRVESISIIHIEFNRWNRIVFEILSIDFDHFGTRSLFSFWTNMDEVSISILFLRLDWYLEPFLHKYRIINKKSRMGKQPDPRKKMVSDTAKTNHTKRAVAKLSPSDRKLYDSLAKADPLGAEGIIALRDPYTPKVKPVAKKPAPAKTVAKPTKAKPMPEKSNFKPKTGKGYRYDKGLPAKESNTRRPSGKRS